MKMTQLLLEKIRLTAKYCIEYQQWKRQDCNNSMSVLLAKQPIK